MIPTVLVIIARAYLAAMVIAGTGWIIREVWRIPGERR